MATRPAPRVFVEDIGSNTAELSWELLEESNEGGWNWVEVSITISILLITNELVVIITTKITYYYYYSYLVRILIINYYHMGGSTNGVPQ